MDLERQTERGMRVSEDIGVDKEREDNQMKLEIESGQK